MVRVLSEQMLTFRRMIIVAEMTANFGEIVDFVSVLNRVIYIYLPEAHVVYAVLKVKDHISYAPFFA